MLRIPHCLDSRITDGGKVVNPTHRPRSIHRERYSSVSDIHFCLTLTEPHGPVRLEGLGKLKKLIQLIGSRTSDLPARSLVP
jgi:hypothetical protein